MAALVLKDVSKVYSGTVTAVEDLNLEIRDQELVVLVGPSGCGKTTTLRLIAGLEDPDRGAIWIDGRQVNDVAPRDRDIAMVFQHNVLYPHMTVLNNMAVSLRWRSEDRGIRRCWRRMFQPAEARRHAERRRAITAQVLDVAGILGIQHLLDRFPRQLSGGECQLVALGRAIVRQPAAFLLDEPLSHLDAQTRIEMRRELKRLHQRLKQTLVYVTHDQAEALALGDRIVVMHRGRIQQSGTPREVYEQPANLFVAGFLGSPGMNLLRGRWHRRPEGITFRSGGMCVCWTRGYEPTTGSDEDEVVLGIRPEHLRLHDARAVQTTAGGSDAACGAQVVGAGRVVSTEWSGPAPLATVRWESGDRDPSAAGCGPAAVEWVVAMPPGHAVEVGREVTVGLDPAWIRLFDARTGEELTTAARAREARPRGRALAGGQPPTEN